MNRGRATEGLTCVSLPPSVLTTAMSVSTFSPEEIAELREAFDIFGSSPSQLSSHSPHFPNPPLLTPQTRMVVEPLMSQSSEPFSTTEERFAARNLHHPSLFPSHTQRMSDKDLVRLMDLVDEDRSGEIDFDEVLLIFLLTPTPSLYCFAFAMCLVCA